MSKPISTVVKIASSPDQAKMFVAMLAAEGIPAFTDGSPPDEFSMSQRMMNLSGVKIMVPTEAADRAKEILAPHDAEVDLDELTRQALQAEDPEDGPIGGSSNG